MIRLRRAKDQMDREYAKPLDVEGLAWLEPVSACLVRAALRPVRNREAGTPGSA
jgi:hypothetical protein